MNGRAAKDAARLALDVLGDLAPYAQNCHAASLRIVKAAVFPEARVARGGCRGVSGQHSWVVLSLDAYDRTATIVDPTLWSYDLKVAGIWTGTYADGRHVPHGGWESIWEWGRPAEATDEPIVLMEPDGGWSRDAARFLDLLGPLDRHGWIILASEAPVHGWPAGEILAAMDATPALSALVPIDRLGMLTDRNPGGLYLPGDA